MEYLILGLWDNIWNCVKSKEPKTLAEVVKHARLGETLQNDSVGTKMLHDTMQAAIAELQTTSWIQLMGVKPSANTTTQTLH